VHISGIRVNCDGSMVCALATAAGSGGSRDPRLLVYCAALNGPLCLDFSAHHAAPVAACWDAHDPRLLAVQTQPLQLAQRGSSGAGDVPAAWGDVATVFASDEAGLLLQEFQGVGCDAAGGAAGLLGVAAPNLLLLPSAAAAATRASAAGAPGSSGAAGGAGGVQRVLLRCFSGIPGGVDDAATRAALLDFNYLLAVGRPHDAFKAVARVRSKAAAQTMAQMAIKSKQLDAAGAGGAGGSGRRHGPAAQSAVCACPSRHTHSPTRALVCGAGLLPTPLCRALPCSALPGQHGAPARRARPARVCRLRARARRARGPGGAAAGPARGRCLPVCWL
jgi:hypothetical protein